MKMAAAHVKLGNMEAARKAAQNLLEDSPKFSFKRFAKRMTIIKDKAQREDFFDALRKSGLPE